MSVRDTIIGITGIVGIVGITGTTKRLAAS
jgi:hypothetical protein